MTNKEKQYRPKSQLVSHAKRSIVDFSNSISTLNRMTTRLDQRKQASDQMLLDGSYSYNDGKKDKGNKYREYDKGTRKPRQRWREKMKWEFLPEEVCSACGQNNHEIYKTGCPAMAVFCNCQKFFNKSKPVMEQFAKFKKSQREKQAARKKDMRRTVKQLDGCGDSAMIKKEFADQHYDEFQEEMLNGTDFDLDTFSISTEDDASNTTSSYNSEE